jgi:DNA-binding PadR family transcriptional regulator
MVSRRPSPQTRAVLDALAVRSDVWRYGYELIGELGMKSGSLYPILMRLADRGLLETVWETEPRPGRPARHLYRLTRAGLAYAAATVAEARPAPRRGSLIQGT